MRRLNLSVAMPSHRPSHRLPTGFPPRSYRLLAPGGCLHPPGGHAREARRGNDPAGEGFEEQANDRLSLAASVCLSAQFGNLLIAPSENVDANTAGQVLRVLRVQLSKIPTHGHAECSRTLLHTFKKKSARGKPKWSNR